MDYVKLQAVIKSAASAAFLRGGRASGRLDHGFLFAIVGRASGQKIIKISDSEGFHLPLPCITIFGPQCVDKGARAAPEVHADMQALEVNACSSDKSIHHSTTDAD